MTTEDFKQLEGLLGKLETFIGSRYEFTPWPAGKGARMVALDAEGDYSEEEYGPDIEIVAHKLKEKINNKK